MSNSIETSSTRSKPRPLSFYSKSQDEISSHFKVSTEHGLSDDSVNQRFIEYGENKIPDPNKHHPIFIFFNQFKDFLTLVLIASAVIAFIVGENSDVYTIVAIIFLNSILGFIQEYRAEKALAALRSLSSPIAKVKRSGQISSIPAYQLVPGDIIYLEAGDLIPADLRIIEATEFKTDESTLTGESTTILKTHDILPHELLGIGDQRNMAFKGTLVTNGRCLGIVVATGTNTELGKIGQLLRQEVEVKTPLQNRLNVFAKKLSFIVFLICLFIFAVGILRGEDIILSFMTSLSLAVAAIPEALPAIVVMTLSLGARKMSLHKALVRKLPAVETLGSVTIICSDKTGTLTLNKMQVTHFFVDNKHYSFAPNFSDLSDNWKNLLRTLALNNDTYISSDQKTQGDPTEVALFEAALNSGYNKIELLKNLPRIAEIPFSSERGLMITIHDEKDKKLVLIKGAPEKVILNCSNAPLDQIKDAIAQMTAQGLRVLAIAEKHEAEINLNTADKNLSFLGLVGMMDPPRAEVKKSIELCKASGIKVAMITGDHPSTAMAIAEKINLLEQADPNQVLTGQELEKLSDEQLAQRIESIKVFARVAPEQKIRIVKAFQKCGEIVAMTGDGVNDAPALKRADVGVSMGLKGTDVAREASHIILLDDNFATIVNAIKEGRRIYDNIRKFVRFALAGNSGEIWTVLLSPLMGIPTALLPIQILWVNLVTDGLPGLALASEPAEKNIMQRSPRPPNESLFAHGLWQHSIWVGILIGLITLLPATWAYHQGNENWQTIAFTLLTFSQLAHVMAIRSEKQSLFKLGLMSNWPLLLAILITAMIHFAVLYFDFMNKVFKTKPLSLSEAVFCMSLSSVVFIAVEVEKYFRRRKDAIPI